MQPGAFRIKLQGSRRVCRPSKTGGADTGNCTLAATRCVLRPSCAWTQAANAANKTGRPSDF